ncbi:MAG: hypothetical protein VXA09_07885 [Burkholderiaceae bacterium]
MSYKPIHNYRRKDKLNPGDPDKIIYGSDLHDDFEAISQGMGALEGQIDQIQGEIDSLPQYVEEAPVNGTAYVRANAAWIPVGTDGGGGSPILPPSGGLTFWDELLEKPEGISALGYENTVDGGTYGKGIL